MPVRPRRLWTAFIRAMIVLLALILVLSLVLWRNQALLRQAVLSLPGLGIATLPDLGPNPPPPQIDAPAGAPPAGPLALWGDVGGMTFGCTFLLTLDNGRTIAISAAHATRIQPGSLAGRISAPDGSTAAEVNQLLVLGQPLVNNHLSSDYVFWTLSAPPRSNPLRPDPRGAAQPGERIWATEFGLDTQGQPIRWAGVMLSIENEAAWARMDDSFAPHGFSGCPVISQTTGRLVGMLVAGGNLHPTVIGIHPLASLLEKAATLPAP